MFTKATRQTGSKTRPSIGDRGVKNKVLSVPDKLTKNSRSKWPCFKEIVSSSQHLCANSTKPHKFQHHKTYFKCVSSHQRVPFTVGKFLEFTKRHCLLLYIEQLEQSFEISKTKHTLLKWFSVIIIFLNKWRLMSSKVGIPLIDRNLRNSNR